MVSFGFGYSISLYVCVKAFFFCHFLLVCAELTSMFVLPFFSSYVPPDEDWVEKEEALLGELRLQDEKNKSKLETELPGSDDLLVSYQYPPSPALLLPQFKTHQYDSRFFTNQPSTPSSPLFAYVAHICHLITDFFFFNLCSCC